jgi:anti-sigma B factor antagonist
MSDPGEIALTQGPLTEGNSLDIAVDHSEEGVLVRLHGRVGLDSSVILRDRLLVILQGQAPKSVVVDLTEVSFIDAAGIATLLEGLKIARSRSATLCLKGLQGRVVRLFEVTGLKAVFETGCKGAPSELR